MEDLVLSETLEFSEDTQVNGNGFSIICNDCDPAFTIAEGVDVEFNDVRFPKVYRIWLRKDGAEPSEVSWNSEMMQGYLRILN